MHSRFVVPILCAAAIAFACGPRSHAGDSAAAATAAAASPSTVRRAAARHNPKGPVIASSLDVSVADARTAASGAGAATSAAPAATSVTLTFHVTNDSDKSLELTFPSGQTHDFAVVDSAGRTVWRWSADRMFTQALRNQVLESGETTTFDGKWEPGALRGRFVAVATLKSDNHPIESRVEFTLP